MQEVGRNGAEQVQRGTDHRDLEGAGCWHGDGDGDVCRRYGVSSATFYKWKAKFGGLEVPEAKRLRLTPSRNPSPPRCVRWIADSWISGLRVAQELDWAVPERSTAPCNLRFIFEWQRARTAKAHKYAVTTTTGAIAVWDFRNAP